MKSRVKAIFACGLITLLLGSLISFYGYEATLKLWSIPPMTTHFADLRTITGGADSYADGYDPMRINPGDPGGRSLNYPRVWQGLYVIGINESHTTYLGLAMILSFLTGVCLILPQSSNAIVLLVAAAVLSPATLLGIERGNIDLLMFFLAALAAWLAQRRPALSAAAVLLASVLKLFPIFASVVLVGLGRAVWVKYALAVLCLFALYVGLTYSDIQLIIKGTPQSINLSYGLNVLWMSLATLSPAVGGYAKLASWLMVFIALVHACRGLWCQVQLQGQQTPAICLDAFRAGSAIYVGTFMLGNNWDYRLMFLILTLPQLAIWLKGADRYVSVWSAIVLSAIFISMWHMVIDRLLYVFEYGDYINFALDELSHWSVFAGLLYLLMRSMPAWAKSYLRKTSAH